VVALRTDQRSVNAARRRRRRTLELGGTESGNVRRRPHQATGANAAGPTPGLQYHQLRSPITESIVKKQIQIKLKTYIKEIKIHEVR